MVPVKLIPQNFVRVMSHTQFIMCVRHTQSDQYLYIDGESADCRPLEIDEQGFRLLLTFYECVTYDNQSLQFVTIQPTGDVEQYLCNDILQCAALVSDIALTRGELSLDDPRYWFITCDSRGFVMLQPTNIGDYYLDCDGHQLYLAQSETFLGSESI